MIRLFFIALISIFSPNHSQPQPLEPLQPLQLPNFQSLPSLPNYGLDGLYNQVIPVDSNLKTQNSFVSNNDNSNEPSSSNNDQDFGTDQPLNSRVTPYQPISSLSTLSTTSLTMMPPKNSPLVKISVQRIGSSELSCSVDYATHSLSALENQDFEPLSGTLFWNKNEWVPKNIQVRLKSSISSEFYVNLMKPVNATLGVPSFSVIFLNANSTIYDGSDALPDSTLKDSNSDLTPIQTIQTPVLQTAASSSTGVASSTTALTNSSNENSDKIILGMCIAAGILILILALCAIRKRRKYLREKKEKKRQNEVKAIPTLAQLMRQQSNEKERVHDWKSQKYADPHPHTNLFLAQSTQALVNEGIKNDHLTNSLHTESTNSNHQFELHSEISGSESFQEIGRTDSEIVINYRNDNEDDEKLVRTSPLVNQRFGSRSEEKSSRI